MSYAIVKFGGLEHAGKFAMRKHTYELEYEHPLPEFPGSELRIHTFTAVSDSAAAGAVVVFITSIEVMGRYARPRTLFALRKKRGCQIGLPWHQMPKQPESVVVALPTRAHSKLTHFATDSELNISEIHLQLR